MNICTRPPKTEEKENSEKLYEIFLKYRRKTATLNNSYLSKIEDGLCAATKMSAAQFHRRE